MPDMSTTDTREPRPGRHATWLRCLWWADAIVVIGFCTLIAGAHLAVEGVTFAALTPLCWAFAFMGLKVGARREYRRGWRHGYESAARAMLQRSLGRTPDVHVRATVHGDPTPEPWHRHIPIRPAEFEGG